MAVADRSIDPKILDSARKEFLLKGYMDASLREICRNAGVTTGALYKRFSGKEALFEASVAAPLQAAEELIADLEQYRRGCLMRHKVQFIWDLSEKSLEDITEYLFEQQEGFRLLLCRSEGTVYSGFLNSFVDENVSLTLALMDEAIRKGMLRRGIDADDLHILLTAYWNALFEPIVHNLPKEQALRYCNRITKFFNWQALFKMIIP